MIGVLTCCYISADGTYLSRNSVIECFRKQGDLNIVNIVPVYVPYNMLKGTPNCGKPPLLIPMITKLPYRQLRVKGLRKSFCVSFSVIGMISLYNPYITPVSMSFSILFSNYSLNPTN